MTSNLQRLGWRDPPTLPEPAPNRNASMGAQVAGPLKSAEKKMQWQITDDQNTG